jgi:hypothetical protein
MNDMANTSSKQSVYRGLPPNRGSAPSLMALRALTEQAIPDALFVRDHNGRLIEENTRSCDFPGYAREELLSMYCPTWTRTLTGYRDKPCGYSPMKVNAEPSKAAAAQGRKYFPGAHPLRACSTAMEKALNSCSPGSGEQSAPPRRLRQRKLSTAQLQRSFSGNGPSAVVEIS